jgi:hypothetical protein
MTEESTSRGVHLVGGMPLRSADEVFSSHMIHDRPAVDAGGHRHSRIERQHVAER